MSRIVRASHGSTNDAMFSLISLELGAGKRVLDLGAGRGHMASRLAEHARCIPAGFHIAPARAYNGSLIEQSSVNLFDLIEHELK